MIGMNLRVMKIIKNLEIRKLAPNLTRGRFRQGGEIMSDHMESMKKIP
jgi:hypothetical protein